MEKITLTINENTGSAIIAWNETHYETFISVPYKASRWVNLCTTDNNDAKDKALKELKVALLRCGMC